MGVPVPAVVQPGDQTKLSTLLQSFAEESKARAALASAEEKAEPESGDTAAEDGQPPVKKHKTMDPSETEVRKVPGTCRRTSPDVPREGSNSAGEESSSSFTSLCSTCCQPVDSGCCLFAGSESCQSVGVRLQELAEQEKTISIILSKFALDKAPHNYKVSDDPMALRISLTSQARAFPL